MTEWKGNKFRPFCSERCKLIDLGDWADEKFKVTDDFDENTVSDTYIDEE